MGGCKIGFVTSLSAFYEILAAELGRKCFGRSDPSEYTVVGVERHFWDSGRFWWGQLDSIEWKWWVLWGLCKLVFSGEQHQVTTGNEGFSHSISQCHTHVTSYESVFFFIKTQVLCSVINDRRRKLIVSEITIRWTTGNPFYTSKHSTKSWSSDFGNNVSMNLPKLHFEKFLHGFA